MVSFRAPLLIALLALTLAPAPSHAAITKEGAAKVKTLVQNFIQQQKKLGEIDGVTRITYQGDVMVEEAGEYYAVTLPYTKLTYPDGNQVDVGMISINASEADSPGQWKMRLAIPTPMIVTDKAGKEVTRVTIGGQSAAGIWDEGLQSFVKLDAVYKDVILSGAEGNFKIPEAQIIYDFTKNAANKWSGPGSVAIKNPEMIATANGGGAKADLIRADFTLDQYDASALRSYREKMAALAESMNKDAKKDGAISPAHTAGIFNTMIDFFTNSGNGMKIRYDVSGLKISKPAIGDQPATTISMPKGFFGLDLSGFTTGKIRLGIKAGYDGFQVSPEPAGGEGLTPSQANIDIVTENIPIKEILELSKNTLDATLKQPEMQQLAGISFLFKLPALLSQSGTYMTVTDTHIGNAEFDMKVEGRAVADISAVNSVTVDSKATFRGLDALLAKLKTRETSLTSPAREKLQSTIQYLEMVKEKARLEKSPTGEPLHVLQFVVNPQGQMLLNGEDAKTLKQGGKKTP